MAAFRILLGVIAACLAAPGAAAAGTVTVVDGVLTFTAGAAEVNAVGVSQPGGAGADFELSDGGPAPQEAADACTVNGSVVTCAAAGITEVRVLLGDLNDSASTAGLAVLVRFDGGDDNDVLAGAGGGETLIGGRGEDTLTGGAGNDVLDAGRGDDDVFGGADDDVLAGDAGDDLLEGGAGADQIDAGEGADVVRARDNEADGVVCGSEFDAVTVDFPDTVAADCEHVDRSPDPDPPPAPAPAPTATPAPSPAAPPAPARDRTAPVILVSKRSIRVDRLGRFRVVLVSANEAAVGSLVADTDTRPRLRLGRSVFVLRTAARTPVRVKLTAAGLRAVRRVRGRSLPVRVRVAAGDAAGNTVQVTARVRVKLP